MALRLLMVVAHVSPAQSDYQLDRLEEVRLINIEAAKLAKHCTAAYMAKHPGSKKFVAGAVGPTSKTLSVSPSVENPAFRCGWHQA